MDQEVKKNYNLPKKILITAGPTIEPLDPVRYITNHSSGTMGYKIAEKAVKEGYSVSIISGPVNLSPPKEAEIIPVTTASDMKKEVVKRIKEYDCIVMTAAVCDFRPVKTEKKKIKKQEKYSLELIKNIDILMAIKDVRQIGKIGFALETENPVENGKKKLREKGLDLIIVNTKTEKSDPFGDSTIKRDYVVINAEMDVQHLRERTKDEMAEIIKEEIGKLV